MTVYSAESFLRAKIEQPILKATVCPITVRVSKLPTLTNGLLTISPNTENEEIVEYNNPQAGTMTIDIIKRGIKPTSILLTTDGVDYNNTSFQFLHSQNDLIRWDVNHIHVNQGIGNSTLATNLWVGISKLSVAAVDAGNPIVVWDNDPRLTPSDSSTTVKWVTKLSVAPVSAANPIAVGDNDSRLIAKTDATISISDVTTNNVSTARHWWAPKLPNDATKFLDWTGSYTAPTTMQVYAINKRVWNNDASLTITSGFRPKIVKISAYYATNGTFAWHSSSSGTLTWNWTSTDMTIAYMYFANDWAYYGSNASATNNVIILREANNAVAYTWDITATGLTLTRYLNDTLTQWNWYCIIECIW